MIAKIQAKLWLNFRIALWTCYEKTNIKTPSVFFSEGVFYV